MRKKRQKKSSYHHENLKEELIQTALIMLEDTGLGSITLRELTARLGSSRTSVYRHFSSKEHLFQAVILEGFNRLDNVLKPILLDEKHSVQVRLYKMGKAYINFAIANKALYRLMLGNQLHGVRERDCLDVEMPADTGFRTLISLITEAQKEEIFKAGQPEVLATIIWATIHGQSSLLIDSHPMVQNNRDVIFDESYSILIQGLQL